jgi:hypothetical protein
MIKYVSCCFERTSACQGLAACVTQPGYPAPIVRRKKRYMQEQDLVKHAQKMYHLNTSSVDEEATEPNCLRSRNEAVLEAWFDYGR